MVLSMFRIKNKLYSVIIAAAAAALLPMALNFIDFIGFKTSSNALNIYAVVIIFTVPFVIIDRYTYRIMGGGTKTHKSNFFFSRRILTILSAILIGYNFWTTNMVYFKADVIKTFTMNFENRLFSRFEQIEGFTLDTPIAVISDGRYVYGKDIGENYDLFPKIKGNVGFRFNIMGLGINSQVATIDAKILIENLLGISVNTATEEQIEEIMKTDEYKSMGVYPAFDSAKMINGVAVINMCDKEIN